MDMGMLTTIDLRFEPLLLVGSSGEIATAVAGWLTSGLAVRVVRGRKMRSRGGLFDEFAAAFQYPLHFGENMDAFDECIAELEGVSAGEGFVVVIVEPEQVLVEDAAAVFNWLTQSLAAAAEKWALPVALGEWWDRDAVPFHIVLACDSEHSDAVANRWSAVGCRPIGVGDL